MVAGDYFSALQVGQVPGFSDLGARAKWHRDQGRLVPGCPESHGVAYCVRGYQNVLIAVVGDHDGEQVSDRNWLRARLLVDDVLGLQIFRVRVGYCDDCFRVRQNREALRRGNDVVAPGPVLEVDCGVVRRLQNRFEAEAADPGRAE